MKTLEYDFAKALGWTIKEKYEELFKMIMDLNGSIIVSSPEIISIFETSKTGFTPTYVLAGDLWYVGTYGIDYQVQVYKSMLVAKDELVVFNKDGNTLIKFINYIWD